MNKVSIVWTTGFAFSGENTSVITFSLLSSTSAPLSLSTSFVGSASCVIKAFSLTKVKRMCIHSSIFLHWTRSISGKGGADASSSLSSSLSLLSSTASSPALAPSSLLTLSLLLLFRASFAASFWAVVSLGCVRLCLAYCWSCGFRMLASSLIVKEMLARHYFKLRLSCQCHI